MGQAQQKDVIVKEDQEVEDVYGEFISGKDPAQLSLFDSKIERPKTSEDVINMPGFSTTFNLFYHGQGKTLRAENESESRTLVSVNDTPGVDAEMRGPVILDERHGKVLGELARIYQETGYPVYKYLEIPIVTLNTACDYAPGTGSQSRTHQRVIDLRHTILTIRDDSVIDDFINCWDEIYNNPPSDDFKAMLESNYKGEVEHLRRIRNSGKKGYITLNLINSLAGEEDQPVAGTSSSGEKSLPSASGNIGVRLNPLIALFFKKNRNIFLPKAYSRITKKPYTRKILGLLKTNSEFYDRYLKDRFLAWFMPAGWTGFKSRQQRSDEIKDILNSFIECEDIGQIVDGIRFVEGMGYDTSFLEQKQVKQTGDKPATIKKKKIFKIIRVERIPYAIESTLIANNVQRGSETFRLVSIMLALSTSWKLRKYKDSNHRVVCKKDLEDPMLKYEINAPLDEIIIRMTRIPINPWSKSITILEALDRCEKIINRLKNIGIIESTEICRHFGIQKVVWGKKAIGRYKSQTIECEAQAEEA